MTLAALALLFAAPVTQIQLSDTAGHNTSIKTEGKVTALIFVSTRCPISRDYQDRIKTLYRDFSAKGIQFVFVNSNFNESADEVEQHAKDNQFPFAVWKDVDNVTADLFGAQSTPEAYLIDQKGEIRYHGAIDDSRNPAKVTRQALRDALTSVLAGQPVAIAETKAFGCTIKRARKSS